MGFIMILLMSPGFSEDDLVAIENRMTELVKADYVVNRTVMGRDQAIDYFRNQGEVYKAEIIESIPGDEELSLYGQDDFTDLCRGPHVPSTGHLKAFKLNETGGVLIGVAIPIMKFCNVFTALPGQIRNS